MKASAKKIFAFDYATIVRRKTKKTNQKPNPTAQYKNQIYAFKPNFQ
ncbi:hypothetical protein [Undibacterium sp. SXout20W]